MIPKTWIKVITGAVLTAAAALGATFGTVVPIGGQAADIALDEARGVLYVANFTANRIDVMTLANNTIQTSINVNPNPSSLSISPDGHWLLVAHFGNNAAPASPSNALTLIDLTANNSKQVISLGNPPLGVAFGLDNNALVVTTNEFIQFNPSLGTTQTLETIAQVATNAIPQPPTTFANQFAQASLAVSRDGLTIAGFGGTSPYLLFRYNVGTKVITSAFYTSQPPAGPRVVSLADDGSLATFAWWVADANLIAAAQWGNPSGLLSTGTTLIDSSRSVIYAQVPPSGTTATANTNPPSMMINDIDNLTVEEQLYLPENFAGKSLLTGDHNTIYGISDSGVMVLPIGNLGSYPRVKASATDLVFRGNFCDRSVNTQTLTIVDPGGGSTPFSIAAPNGIRVSPSSGVTPAVVSVSIDPAAFASQKGTTAAALTISSGAAVNFPLPVRVLISSPDPSQRGTFVDIPGRVVDIQTDPKRQVYYVLRQDVNQVLVYSNSNNTLQAILRTCTTPTSMAITFDQQDLLVGCDNSHYLSVFDLDLLQAQTPVSLPADYVESIAASSNAILAVVRTADGSGPKIDRIDLVTHSASRLPSLGVWQNQITQDMVLVSSSNGANILAAGSDGSVLIYNAVAGTFTVSRKDFAGLGGSYAASNFNQFEVGNHLLDSSGVPKINLSTASGSPSGFAFVNQTGYYTTAPNTSSPGTIAQVDLTKGLTIQPTAMIEAPILGSGFLTASNSQSCTSSTANAGTTTITTLTCVVGTTQFVTQTVCPVNSASNCNISNTVGTIGSPSFGLFSPPYSAFTHSLAPLPDQSEIVALTTSGFTVLPWTYAASVAAPQISKVASAADGSSPVAPGGLVSIFGNQFSPTNLATSQIPLPTALANSCLTVNGQPMPLVFVSPGQINAQMPTEAVGAVTLNVHTPGGISDNFNITVLPNAPAVFMSGVAGPQTNLPTVVRDQNNTLVTDSNPIHRGDNLTIYLTGIGQTSPVVGDGLPAPVSPLAIAVQPPAVQLGGVNLPVNFAGLSPGQVGVGQINVTIPGNVPEGLNMPLTINQGGTVQSLSLRVVQ